MAARFVVAFVIAGSVLAAAAGAQDKPAPPAPPAAPAGAPGSVGAVVARETKGLSADDFAQREEALGHLQALVADQLKQRAQIQEVIGAFQADLMQQQRALAMVTDDEAQAQIAGLLEMERGLTSWTIQTMSEPAPRRTQLFNWGLTKENAPVLAQAYAQAIRIRLDGVKQLAKLTDDGANWTLSRLINDKESAVRAGAMAACWSRPASADIVGALWFRAVTGPEALGDTGRPMGMTEGRMIDALGVESNNAVKVEFPGGDPIDFDDTGDGNEFFDSQLASDVLVHMNSPAVGEKVKALVAQRAQLGKTLSLNSDPDWTLVAHRLVEAYKVKEAIPILAAEALGADSDDMGGEMNGRPFMWSRRTMAMGTLARLIGKEPADFDLIRARDQGDPRGWMWAVDVNPQQMVNGNAESDGAAVRAFYAFWKDHHGEFGVAEAPSDAAVPPVPVPGQAVPPGFPRRYRPVPAEAPPAPASTQGQPPDAPTGNLAPGAAPASAPAPAMRAGAPE